MQVEFNQRRRGSAFGNAAAAATAAAEREMAEMSHSHSSTSTASSTTKVTNNRKKQNVDIEVSSAMIRNFDDGDDEEFYDDDDSAYDAIFGRPMSDINRSKNADGQPSNEELEEALEKERRTKCVLFAILIIVSITCLSTIVTQKRLLRLRDSGQYRGESKGSNKFYNDDVFDDDRAVEVDDFLSENNGGSSGNGNGHTNKHSNDAVHDDEEDDGLEKGYNNNSNFGEIENNDQQHGLFGPDEEESEYQDETGSDDKESEDHAPTDTIESPLSYDQNHNNEDFDDTNEIPYVDDMEILESRFGNVREEFQISGKDLPFLFFIPRTGSALVERLLLQCTELVAASGRNAIGDSHGHEPYLEIITTSSNEQFVNVDLRTKDGIDRANKLNLVSSRLADVIFTSRINLASELFHSPYRGRCFALFRDPIERATSVFYALKNAPWESSFKEEFSDMTIEEYAFSEYLESNWVVRMITNKISGKITDDDLKKAKHFIENKCLVGLTNKFDESYGRIKQYFGWRSESDVACERELKGHDENQNSLNRYLAQDISKVVYDQFYKENELDIQLYEHALKLFDEQKSIMQ